MKQLTDNSTIQLYHELKRLEAEQDDAKSSTRPKRSQTYIKRDRELAHDRIWNNYFDDHPIYPANIFRRRFRMRKELFLRIVDGISNHSVFFFNKNLML